MSIRAIASVAIALGVPTVAAFGVWLRRVVEKTLDVTAGEE